MAQGIRLSPGVYKDPKTGKTYQSKTGAAPKASGLKDSPKKIAKANPGTNTKQLSANEAQVANQQQVADIGVGEARQGMLPQVQDAYSQPYNYQGPQQAVYNPEERQRIEGELVGRFERYDAPQRQQENEDLARWSQSTGNPIGSPAYNAKAKLLTDSQNQRGLDYKSQAVSQGLQESQGQFDMDNQAFQTGVDYYNQTRDRPVGEYANLQGLIQSTPGAQEFNYQTRLQQQDYQNQNKLLKASRTGGGGSGGRGMTQAPQTFRPVPNFTAQAQQPSFWSQAGSSLAGPLVSSFAKKGGEYLASSLFE